jgi:hypothetical protein
MSEMTLVIECDGVDLFITVGGVKIAKRGQRGTPHAKVWIPLEPGWSVLDVDYPTKLEVRRDGVLVH